MIYLSFLSFFFVRSTHYFDLTFSIVILLRVFFLSLSCVNIRVVVMRFTQLKSWVVHLNTEVNSIKFEPLSLKFQSFLLCVSHSFCHSHSDNRFVIVLFHFSCVYISHLSVRCHFCAIFCSCSKHQNVVRQR